MRGVLRGEESQADLGLGPVARAGEGGYAQPERRAASVIQAIWRRKFAILMPLLVMLPISFAAAMWLPQKYIARSLILFQESDIENPLVRRSQLVSERLQDRISGMRALLRSDNVLSKVVDELAAGQQLTALQRANHIQDLRSALELDNVGNNLLEFRLAGNRASGLGAELEIVLKHFLDSYRSASPYRTPERIVAIDRPSDPTAPIRSKAIVFIGGILAGLVMGVALAVLLESMDHTLRKPHEFEQVSGLPVVARLPAIPDPLRRAG